LGTQSRLCIPATKCTVGVCAHTMCRMQWSTWHLLPESHSHNCHGAACAETWGRGRMAGLNT
jgi:hypothetical protein